MASRLQRELKTNKPFASLEHEAFLNVLRTASALQEALHVLFKPYGISQAQYNVLRILRGASPPGLPCKEIGERMVTRVPDVTRLLDRLEARKLVLRERDTNDRRVVLARITPEGRALIDELDGPIRQIHLRQLSHLGQDKLEQLIVLLEEARDTPANNEPRQFPQCPD